MRLSDPKFRYLAVGGFCAAIHNAIVIGGAWIGVPWLAGIGVSYAVVVVVGYLLHVHFTFAQTVSRASFLKYATAMLGNYPLTAAFMYLGCGLLHAPVAVASPLTTLAMIVWNYGVSRWAIGNRLFAGSRKTA